MLISRVYKESIIGICFPISVRTEEDLINRVVAQGIVTYLSICNIFRKI